MTDLYERIENLCKEHNISITKMCTESGASRGSLGDLASGKIQNLSLKTLQKIANYFDVSVMYLLGTETKKAPAKSDGGELDEYLELLQSRPEFKLLFHTFKSASKDQIEAIVLAWEARNGMKGE